MNDIGATREKDGGVYMMNNYPMVSVVMMVYNEEQYIDKAIDSILGQTLTDWELIIVNDGSVDDTSRIIHEYADRDSRVRVIEYCENQGNPYARNMGIDHAVGKYICFFAGDDIALPEMLECQVEYMERHPECIHVQGNYEIIDRDGTVIGNRNNKFITNQELKTALLFQNNIVDGGSLTRKRVFEDTGIRANLALRSSQDYLLYIDIQKYGEYSCIDKYTHQYRMGHGSKSKTIMKAKSEWYDELMYKIVGHAWAIRGIKLKRREVSFIYEYLYKNTPVLSPSAILLGLSTYKKIKDQISVIGDEGESKLIKNLYIKKWMMAYFVLLYEFLPEWMKKYYRKLKNQLINE